jgi:DNA-binding transcriptional LysR family regulator
MVELKSLETFFWVATLGSFRGAALKLNTTQPAVSQRIAQLERDLGTRLLHREKRAATPTPRGRAVLGYAEKLIGLRAEMLARLADTSSLTGVVRLGVAETIVHTWLTPFIRRVNRTYPNLALEIEVDISPNLRDRLLAQEIDLAFLLGPPSAPSVRSRALCSYPVAFIASLRIEWTRTPVPIGDLARHPIITFSRNTQPYIAVRSLFNRPDLPSVRLHASASLATVVHMAMDGLGIAVIPPAIVRRELGEKKLGVVETELPRWDLAFVSSWLAAPDTRAAESLAQIAIEIAAEHEPDQRLGEA